MHSANLFVVAFFMVLTVVARADLLTFEKTPTGTTPVDNAVLSTPYGFTGGTVRFFFDANGNNQYDQGIDFDPVFEQAGTDTTRAFISQFAGGVDDTARPGYEAQLGQFMLRTPAGQGGGNVPGPFIAAYSTTNTITQFSGEIWDIDGGEQWRVDALNGSGAVLASEFSPSFGGSLGPETLDALPWVFQFDKLPAGFASVRISFAGAGGTPGLAFNNFSPTEAVPEPSGIILSFAAISLLKRRRRAAF